MAAIELEGLTKDYGDVLANDGVTFDVERGEIFGYLGPNGAGKTTTIRTLLGFLSPTAGTAKLLGHDVTDEGELLKAKRELGYLPDSPAFDGTATGRDVLDLHGSIKGDERGEELLDVFEPPLDREIRDYSRGNVQKLGLVTTFMHDPELVILDEPTSGLDPLLQQRFTEFVRAERERGLTVFFSSHILREVRKLCDRVGIIRNGRLVTVEPVESLLTRSGKFVRLQAAESIPIDDLEIDGVHGLAAAADAGPSAADEYAFTFTGDVNDLLEVLRTYELIDLSIEEAPLEEVFMRFYGGEDTPDRGTRDDRVAASVDATNDAVRGDDDV
ncbi:ABC transporter ATP-binding protein [Natrinema sp. 74]|uniref:ABC transporter ATP-binding protein n=1 Tax=Natrinema sp. 74 TaxID=3384159 RepID=UPI0038D475DD